ncbi:uncharacterized protein LOC117023139 [Rhinolophus ferrumequinum]|uniref:uncharacterized protein LOC117023139 n=1 Tax=Rhinolophus ferrumequinum TaxID=59479 RepID=UPI00140FDB69|nr:uncharacterized protein LOC117023139 [Rhinolophus ferrumequinum]
MGSMLQTLCNAASPIIISAKATVNEPADSSGFGVEARGGARSNKVASAPSPRPGTVLGSGKTQKTGSISANNSATASVCAAQASGAAGPGSRSPAAGARWEAGASLDAAESAGGACRAALQRLGSGGGMERKGKTYLGAEGSAGLRLQTPDAAGVWHRGPRRKALAQLRAGLHFARTGNSPCHPAPRGALRCHRTERHRHALQSLLTPGSWSLPVTRI